MDNKILEFIAYFFAGIVFFSLLVGMIYLAMCFIEWEMVLIPSDLKRLSVLFIIGCSIFMARDITKGGK